jgi:nitroreductase
MKFLELVEQRFSVRKFKNQPVERDKITRCLEAAWLAPSACNSQPWKYIVVDDPELKDKVARETYSQLVSFNKFVLKAPVIVVFVIEKPKLITQIGEVLKNKEYPLIDIGITAEHFCLQAVEEGLGTCMLGWFNQKPIQQLLGIPKNKTIGLVVALGYPDYEKAPTRKRKEKSVVMSFNGYLGDESL